MDVDALPPEGSPHLPQPKVEDEIEADEPPYPYYDEGKPEAGAEGRDLRDVNPGGT